MLKPTLCERRLYIEVSKKLKAICHMACNSSVKNETTVCDIKTDWIIYKIKNACHITPYAYRTSHGKKYKTFRELFYKRMLTVEFTVKATDARRK